MKATTAISAAFRAAMQRVEDSGKHNVGYIQDVSCHNGYAEPGYGPPKHGIILTGNWNKDHERDTEPRLLDLSFRIGAIAEKMGVDCEWLDEWCACDECQRIVRTEGDSYFWQPYFWMPPEGGCVLCGDCVKENPDDYLEFLKNNDKACLTFEIDLSEHGYTLAENVYEAGWFEGMTDDPQKIGKKLKEDGKDYIFEKHEQSQFYCKFRVWIKNPEPNEEESE